METLEEKEKSTMPTVDRLAMKKMANVSFPSEIMEEILLRLPVRSILRFRSISKPWLSRISHPQFTKLHFTRNTQTLTPRTALLIAVCDKLTSKLHLLSAPHDGGPVTRVMTLDDTSYLAATEAQYLNGLVFCCSMSNRFVLNPSTHHTFKLPDPPSFTNRNSRIWYLFGFNESRNEHQVVNIRIHRPHGPKLLMYNAVEVMTFSMSTYSWTKIDTVLPDGCNWSTLYKYCKGSVCFNSVVHIMIRLESFDILAYDLRTNKFSIITTPQDVVPGETSSKLYTRNGTTYIKGDNPRIIKIEGCIGVVCHDRVLEINEMDIWILRDYENRVWVKEVIAFPEQWIKLECPFPLDAVSMDEIMFALCFVSADRIRLYTYNKTSGCFKSLPFTLGHQSLCGENVVLKEINCYVETMLPL